MEPVKQIEKLLYRPAEAAIVLGTSPAWVYARVGDGTLPAVRLAGRAIRIKKSDLLALMDGQKAGAAA